MSTDVERIEQYLRATAAPEYVSEPHRQQLRRRVLGEVGKKRTVPVCGKPWKIAAAAVILVGLGGAVGAFVEMKYHFVSRGPGGSYQFVSKDATYAYTISDADANDAIDVEQTARELAVIDLLRRQKAVKLVRVIESEINGRLDSRTLVHRYTLPDGRTKTIGEDDLDDPNETPVGNLSTAAWTEIDQLRQTGKVEKLGTQKREVKGREFVFNRERYTLRDGTKVILSVGEPKEAQPPHGEPSKEPPGKETR